MSAMPFATKDPQAQLDFGFNWSQWVATGDEINSASWELAGNDNALTLSNQVLSGNESTVRATGGTVGATYRLVNTVTTSSGLTDQRTITLRIINR